MTAVARQLAEKAFGVKISDIQREALDLFDSITFNPDFQLVMKLEPGDMQFLIKSKFVCKFPQLDCAT
ncbi:hypothetical protein [Paenibacillus larvae]|uniref:hypothetical protein n=1 Tax=Paenibacillus larvae TaxID=1464 RepID=UPI000419166A|nr:putative transposase InsK for insertion sequence element IS150 [Paenibacillus larvae subsp. larvae DSM 25430]